MLYGNAFKYFIIYSSNVDHSVELIKKFENMKNFKMVATHVAELMKNLKKCSRW